MPTSRNRRTDARRSRKAALAAHDQHIQQLTFATAQLYAFVGQGFWGRVKWLLRGNPRARAAVTPPMPPEGEV